MFCKMFSANNIYTRYKFSLRAIKDSRSCCLIIAIMLLTISRDILIEYNK